MEHKNNDSKLIVRIDERTRHMQKEQDTIRQDIGDLKTKVFTKLDDYHGRIKVLEVAHEKNVHIEKGSEKAGFLGFLLNWLKR